MPNAHLGSGESHSTGAKERETYQIHAPKKNHQLPCWVTRRARSLWHRSHGHFFVSEPWYYITGNGKDSKCLWSIGFLRQQNPSSVLIQLSVLLASGSLCEPSAHSTLWRNDLASPLAPASTATPLCSGRSQASFGFVTGRSHRPYVSLRGRRVEQGPRHSHALVRCFLCGCRAGARGRMEQRGCSLHERCDAHTTRAWPCELRGLGRWNTCLCTPRLRRLLVFTRSMHRACLPSYRTSRSVFFRSRGRGALVNRPLVFVDAPWSARVAQRATTSDISSGVAGAHARAPRHGASTKQKTLLYDLLGSQSGKLINPSLSEKTGVAESILGMLRPHAWAWAFGTLSSGVAQQRAHMPGLGFEPGKIGALACATASMMEWYTW